MCRSTYLGPQPSKLRKHICRSRGATPIAFAIAGSIALLTSYAYAKLAVRYPGAGGTVVCLDRAFGKDLATGTLNLVLWLSYLVTIALYASAFASYGTTFISAPQEWQRHALISLAILLPAAINIANSEIVSRSETAIVIVKLCLLALVIGAGIPSIDAGRLSVGTWPSATSLIVGGMVIFVAYEGFELIANASEDVSEPAKTLPRALFGCVVFVIGLYVLVAIVTVGSVPADEIVRQKDYALAAAARPSLGHTGFVLVAVSALLATFSAINATIYGNARLGYALAEEGELPDALDRKTWSRPVSGVLWTTGLSLLLANLIDLTASAILGSAGFLLIFAAVNTAAFALAGETGGNRVISGLGAITCTVALVLLLAHTYQDKPYALWLFLGIIASALAFELVYPRLSGRPPISLTRET